MKYVDEFRDADLIRDTAAEIERLAAGKRYRIMEVCGGHTHSIYRHGLHQLLPDAIELVHGPGCPVCVLPMGRVDDGLNLAAREGLTFTAFGDMMRVPGTEGSALERKAAGMDVRMVYSPLDALQLARDNPELDVMFFAIGFETTAPSTALTLRQAKADGVDNFSVFCNHITIMPALRALLDDPTMQLDGFIGPGHVSTVIGCAPYEEIPERYGKPVAVSGFEPLDLLQSILLVVRQLNAGEASVENQYGRAVTWNGNQAAMAAMDEVFAPRPTFEWRGLGGIPNSALALRDTYAAWDAEARYAVPGVTVMEPEEACCGEVLKGQMKPSACPLFGTECTPQHPVSALMVSSEGACAAQYQYARHEAAVQRA